MKTYVITGATSGIGKALAEYFSKNNIVFAGYRSVEKLEELKSISENIIPFYIDYARPETISQALEYIKSETDKIDTLINVAGCVVAGALEDIPITELKRQFNVNVFGAIELTQGLISVLENGKVINISSMASFGIFPFISPYCASKRALDIFFNLFMLENKHNIKVVSIKPGVIATPLWSKSICENAKTIENSSNYEKESNYLINNAYKNEKHGLKVDKVVKKIAKIEKLKHPKSSYCIGFDAIVTEYVSKFPQMWLNKIIKHKVNRLK